MTVSILDSGSSNLIICFELRQVETLRASHNDIIKIFFTNALSKTGSLTVAFDEPIKDNPVHKSKWGAALVAEKHKARKLDTLSHGQYSQVHKMRTMSGIFRATSLEMLKMLSIGGNSGNTHFVRCIRSTLDYQPRAFHVSVLCACFCLQFFLS